MVARNRVRDHAGRLKSVGGEGSIPCTRKAFLPAFFGCTLSVDFSFKRLVVVGNPIPTLPFLSSTGSLSYLSCLHRPRPTVGRHWLVLGYKGKSGAVPQQVLVYCLFWVSPDFFPHTKKLVQTAFVWVKTLVTLYGCRPTYGTPRVQYSGEGGNIGTSRG